jgi:hypothetical protein
MNTLLAALSGNAVVDGIIYLLVIGVILGLLLFLVAKSPIPQPFKSVLTWVLYVIGVVFLINWLLGWIGHSFINF